MKRFGGRYLFANGDAPVTVVDDKVSRKLLVYGGSLMMTDVSRISEDLIGQIGQGQRGKAKAAGCVITHLDPATVADFQKAVQSMYADYKDYADLIAQIQAVK